MANLLEALLDILRGLFRTQFAILETALSFVRTVINEGTSIVDGVVRFVVGNILVLTVLGGTPPSRALPSRAPPRPQS
ncbi:hypothetical protein JCM10449v2_001598 [Rhodotorula kratochvilovae]